MPDFLLYALIAGLGLALVAGPLGSFVVWRRMAYFGDTLAHSALLGVALGMLLQINLTLAVTVGCALLAVLLVAMQNRKWLASDTLLGILAHSTLSLGLVVLALTDNVRVDLMGYLFGDLLAISTADLGWMLGGVVVVSVLLALLWRRLLAVTVHEELARVEGQPVTAIRMALMLLIAIVIAIAMRVVGVLLVTADLVVTMDAGRRMLSDGAVAVAGDRIVDVGRVPELRAGGREQGPGTAVAHQHERFCRLGRPHVRLGRGVHADPARRS